MPSWSRIPVGAVTLLTLIMGCQPPDRPVEVKGKVTFKGEPVAEGMVQFFDDKTGRGGEATIGADGTYQTTLPPGSYAVLIIPPMITRPSKSDTPPDMMPKKMPNIPVKYHSSQTSGFKAEVSADKTTHDFDMKP
jgi:hypothetical protein